MTITSKITGFLVVLFCLSIANVSVAATNPNAGIEDKVRLTFIDMPEMITIAKCESGFRQFSADGTVLRGGTAKKYIGIYQISESVHADFAKSLGYDIYDTDGNIGYARYMYLRRGNGPWISCVDESAPATPTLTPPPTPSPNPTPSPTPSPTNTPANTSALSVNLSYGMVMPEVVTLQQILNKIGFMIASSGPGSPGSETKMFGQLTREAVRKFQCEKMNICSGSESTTGYGRVGPMTRQALNQASNVK